jgi:uncharacterized membrane protein required for colicin V production
MTLIDFIVVGVVGGFGVAGFSLGLFHMVGSLVGVIAGAVLASRWFDNVGHWASTSIGGSENVWRVVAFTLIYVIVARLCGWIADMVGNTLSFVPFVKTIGRVLGVAFGLLEGLVLVALVSYFASKVAFGLPLANAIKGSVLAVPLSHVGAWLEPLFPAAITAVKSLF